MRACGFAALRSVWWMPVLAGVAEVQHIRNMPNIAKNRLSAAQLDFIEDLAKMLAPWGLPQAEARLYAYLMLKIEPVSLDLICEELGVAKSSASVAARALERYLLVRRYRVKGSKRVLYGVSDNFAGRVAEQGDLMGRLGRFLQDRTAAVAKGDAALRLRALGEFYASISRAMQDCIRQLHDKVPGSTQNPLPRAKNTRKKK
jgi:hypothetical protein